MMGQLLASLKAIVRLFNPAGWACIAAGIVLTVAGFRWSLREPAMIGVALLSLVASALFWTLRKAELDGRRSVEPARVEEGEPARAVMRIFNRGHKRSSRVTGLDHINGRPVSIAIPSIEPGGTQQQGYEVPTDRRGAYRLGPLSIAFTDPFRLLQAASGIGGQASYLVWPSATEIPPLPTGRVRDLEGAASPRTSGSGVTFQSLREYVPGDDLRQIHWRSTARTGTVLVRQNVITSEPRMVIFVDCRAAAYEGEGFEDACRVAASFVRSGGRRSNPVHVLASTGASAEIDSSGAGLESAMDLLARLDPADDRDSLVQLVRLSDRRHRTSSVAVITGDVSNENANLLMTVQGRYASFTVIQLGAAGHVQHLPLAPSALVRASNVEDFARQWIERAS